MTIASDYGGPGYQLAPFPGCSSTASCARSLPSGSWSCPCHSSLVFDKFCRFKENIQAFHRYNCCDLKRGRADFTMGAGQRYFFLFRRMRCFLVNRVKAPSMDALFVTNLSAEWEGEQVPFWMSVRFTVSSQTTAVHNRIDTMCFKHKCNQAEHVEATRFVACPSNVSVGIHIVVGREAGKA